MANDDVLDMSKSSLNKRGGTGPSSAPVVTYGGQGADAVLDAGYRPSTPSEGSGGALAPSFEGDTAESSGDGGCPTFIMESDVDYSYPPDPSEQGNLERRGPGVRGA